MVVRQAFALSLGIMVGGCGRDEVLGPDAPAVVDATSVADAAVDAPMLPICTAAAGTADMTIDGPGPAVTFDRAYAGAILLAGPVVGPAPMTISLFFTGTSPLEAGEVGCCDSGDSSCCDETGLAGETGSIANGAEVGDHPIDLSRPDVPAFAATGTLTITTFVHPFDNMPGQIAGSIMATMGSTVVTGTFDNTFCPELLWVTI